MSDVITGDVEEVRGSIHDGCYGAITTPDVWVRATDYDSLKAERNRLWSALEGLVQHECGDRYKPLDKGIGTATESGMRWLAARAALQEPT